MNATRHDRAPSRTARAEAAAAACAHLLAAADYDGTSEAARALTERALAEFSAQGLLELRFLETGAIGEGDMHELAVILETFAAHSHTLMSVFLINAIFGAASLSFFGSAGQKRRLLPAVRRGERQMAFALTEPGAGSDAASITTSYRRVESGYVINGVKQFTTGADVADAILVVAREEGAQPKARTETVFIVPRGAPGLGIEPMPKLAGHVHASCRVQLDNVELAADTVLGGDEGLRQAWPALRRMGMLERFAVAAVSVGLASAVVQRAIAYAGERQQFGQAIAAFQSIQFALVDMKTREQTMRLLVRDAAEAMEAQPDPTFAVTSAKAYCAEVLQELVGTGMRVMGGRAYFELEPMARYYREAPWVLYAGGTVEIQKRLAARALGIG